ncbi:putative 2OG-Fe(II) oxygenase [Elongatibacter sediminis]|uniref:2OG-Fe(II) oxygenase n=1 Tax=Elongatibacter sediminis TaxID=3119006 RepID=A0AAW9RBC4_9GAMM
MRQPHSEVTETLFPVVVHHREYGSSDLNQGLFDLVKNLQADRSVANRVSVDSITTVGGYQPDVVLHEHCRDDAVWTRFLTEIAEPSVGAYMAAHQQVSGWPVTGTRWRITASWAVLYPASAYQAPHLHRDISCVLTYYARVPVRPRPEGAITFINPHVESTFPAKKNWPYDKHYFPMDGTCLVFPGWLQHFAHPHFAADEERLMFSLDIVFEPPG